MVDTVGQGGALPSMNYIDMEKIKRESSAYNHHPPVTSVLNMPAPPLISPSIMYSGPPPPYSYPSSAASSTVGGDRGGPGAGPGSYISPPETRRTSGDDNEPAAKHQSLPSITEALGGDKPPLSISSLLSTTVPQQKTSYVSRSPASPVARSYLDSLPKGPPTTFPHPTSSSHRPHEPSDNTTRPMFSPTMAAMGGESRFPAISTFPSVSTYGLHHAIQSSRNACSPSTYSRPGASPIQFNKPSSPSLDKNFRGTPSSANTPFGYNVANNYKPSTTVAMSTPGMPSYGVTTIQQPPLSPWKSSFNDFERVEQIRKAIPRDSPPKQAYGESVKRHLDNFDLESSLNEIAEGSGRLLDFSQNYGTRAHQTQRSGPVPGSLPSLNECDDMLREQAKAMDALARMRDVIYKQQQAQIDQRNHDQQSYKPTASEADDESAYMDKLDGSGGFAGSDSKKRRGRAAPPGRCHSCNRAETPEWRRGPDGARTLCNACGLHYAKLTRKMGSKTPGNSSNLRPKESSPSSP